MMQFSLTHTHTRTRRDARWRDVTWRDVKWFHITLHHMTWQDMRWRCSRTCTLGVHMYIYIYLIYIYIYIYIFHILLFAIIVCVSKISIMHSTRNSDVWWILTPFYKLQAVWEQLQTFDSGRVLCHHARNVRGARPLQFMRYVGDAPSELKRRRLCCEVPRCFDIWYHDIWYIGAWWWN